MSAAEGPFGTLSHDGGAERAVAWLRGLAALAVVAASVWLVAATRASAGGLACAGGGLLFSVFWVRAFLRGRRQARGDAPRVALHLTRAHLERVEGEGSVRVPWTEVEGVRADEERLRVVVDRRGRAPLALEPRYRGVGLHDLAARIEAARRAATEDAAGLATGPR